MGLHQQQLVGRASPISSTAAYLGAALVLCLCVHGEELLNHFNLQIIVQSRVIVFRAVGLETKKENDNVKGMTLVSPKSKVGGKIHSWAQRSTPFHPTTGRGPTPYKLCVLGQFINLSELQSPHKMRLS